MEVASSFDLKVPRKRAWELLNDPEVLEASIPGCKSLKQTGPETFDAELAVGMGPVRGTYKGSVRLTEQIPPQSMRMTIEATGGPGFVRGTGEISLEENGPEATRVQIKGSSEAGGMLARVGQRMIAGVANSMMDQFAKNLRKEAARRGAV